MSPEAVLNDWTRIALAEAGEGPLILGLCGAQGSGKSTLAQALARRISGTVVLSLDDFYLGRVDRAALARRVHPLFATRGVPGTHDLALGMATLDALVAGRPCRLPRFDKAADDRVPASAWPRVAGPHRLIVLEGWCVGATALDDADLTVPANALECVEDAQAQWRRHWNEQLRGRYPALFDQIDRLVLLAAPSWDTVLRWRIEQETHLRRNRAGAPGVMDDAAVARFVSLYERLTRYILSEMPGRADLTLRLDVARRVVGLRER